MEGGGETASPVTAKLRASRRRPPRASRACETCRVRKTKCDQAQPCSYCACMRHCRTEPSSCRSQRELVYSKTPSADSRGSEKTRPSPWPDVDQSRYDSFQHVNPPDHSSRGIPRIARSDGSVNASSPDHLTPKRDDDTMPAATPELVCDSASRDGLSGVNIHTNGTEFYGNSSNLAFLGNLYARARTQAGIRGSTVPGNEHIHAPIEGHTAASDTVQTSKDGLNQLTPSPTADTQSEGARPTTNTTQLSIVNLLYNPKYPSQSPLQSDGQSVIDSGGTAKNVVSSQNTAKGYTDISHEHDVIPMIESLSEEAQIEIEKMFIGSYFCNKHYIHPMLCKGKFMQRCEKEAFVISRRTSLYRGSSKFAGLYFAVVALGAINASPHETALLDHYCNYSPISGRAGTTSRPSVLDFADFYFGRAKRALGDLFESCSLEGVQALLLLSVFCQNALRPHSCFMYSGMAVRTAVAIGLASGMTSLSPGVRKEGIRTWWCIYSHEIEMCCSSGRLDSMKDLQYYQVPLPILKVTPGNLLDADAEDNHVAMIPAMAALAQIMSEASHLLYHSPKRSVGEMSHIAIDLDNKLLGWKSTLPEFLNIDAASLNDTEWAFKQKLVLRLRYYNTRILIHKPFLAASASNTEAPNILQHLHACLDAARTSIHMQYESFIHRIYIRTWWYNTSYALYGAMILLHLILSGYPSIRDEDLLLDVEKSLDIFESMNNIVVARRCAEMIREVLEVARACVARRRTPHYTLCTSTVPPPPPLPITGPANPSASSPAPFGLGNPHTQQQQAATNPATSTAPGVDNDFFFSLFNPDSQPNDTRAEILANLVDPIILEDFAFGNGASDFSFFLGT